MALKISKLRHKPGLVVAGPFASGGLYSHFNQHLALQLQQNGSYELGAIPDEPGAMPSDLRLQPALNRMPRELTCQIEHRSLPVLQAPAKGHWVVIQPWEYGSLPQDWQALMHQGADEIWVHTPSNYRACLDEGLSPERLALIPCGLDPEVFNPVGPRVELPHAAPFRFLFVGESLWYSGLDLLLEAFYEEFLPDEPVSLVVAEWTEATAESRKTLLDKLHDLQQKPDCPQILYLDRRMAEAERAALYRSCQTLVYPSRADAFGAQVLEAAACGLPMLLSDLEGRYDLPESSSVTWLPTRLNRQNERLVGGLATLREPFWAEVNPATLRQQLRALYEAHARDPEAAGREAAVTLSQQVRALYSWETVGARVSERLQALSGKPIWREVKIELQAETLRGLEALEAGDDTRAGELLQGVLERSPDDALVLFNLAGIHLQNQAWDEALPLIERALRLAPGHPNLYHAAGIALWHLGAWRLASACFKRTLSLQPDHRGSLESLPHAQQQAGAAGDRSAEFSGLEALLGALPEPAVRQSLSLCMIVKNEESFLRQCLESVRDVVDEIIVVDTGSTDGTRLIAEEFGAKLHDFEWNGSFADARNASIEPASGDWILVLDADEQITPETVGSLRELIAMPVAHLTGYQLRIRNLNTEGNEVDVVEHYMMRVFPNHPALCFKGMIHEQLVSTDPALELDRLAVPDVLILHYGYTGQVMDSRDKFRRNIELIEQSLAREPEAPFHWFNLGVTYRVSNQGDKALEALNKAIALCRASGDWPGYMSATFSYAASILLDKGEFEQARELCEQAPEMCEQNPDFWVNYGSIWNGLGEYEKAIQAFERAMAMRSQSYTSVVSDRAATTWKPYAGIGNTYLMQNRLDKADYYFRRALKENSHNPEILLGLGRLALMREQPQEAQGYFERLIAHPQAGPLAQTARYDLARTRLALGEIDAAEAGLRALLEAADLSESLSTAVRSELSQLMLRQNRTQEAGELLEGLTDSEALVQALARFYHQQGAHEKLLALFDDLINKRAQPQARDYRHRGTVYLHMQHPAEATADFERALQLEPGDAESIHNLGVIALQQDDIQGARARFEAALAINPKLFESLFDLAKLDVYEQLPSARERLLAARAVKPGHPELLETLAYVEFSQGRSEAAAELYMDLLEHNPRHSDALVQLGYILNEAGEHARALQLFERALDLGVKSLVLYNGIGLAFLQQGRYSDARNAFLLALQHDPENPEIQRAVQLADQLCGRSPLELAL